MKKRIAVLLLAACLLLALTACGKKAEAKTITVGATPAPHCEILEVAKELMAKEGYTLVIKEFNDYVIPNDSVEEGELDANYFQHITYMNNFNEEYGIHMVSAAGIHYEPFGLYAGKTASIDALPEGAQIAVPNDATNEARALLLLQEQGIIKLKDGAGITATVRDIEDNPKNITFKEVEAAQLPNVLKDVDYAVINSNYAISAGLNPVKDNLAIEGSSSAYSNILAAKKGNENSDKIKALSAALQSKKVADFIASKYDGAVISVVSNPGDGYDPSVNYDALKGQTITVAASPTPHAEILAVAKEILAAKGVTLDIKEFEDYVQPNNVVESGEIDANYFQHEPYLDDFNKQNNTNIVTVCYVHVEPMALYGGKQTTLDAVK